MSKLRFKRGDLVQFTDAKREQSYSRNSVYGWTLDENWPVPVGTGTFDQTMVVLDPDTETHGITREFKMVKVLCSRTAKVFVTYNLWLKLAS